MMNTPDNILNDANTYITIIFAGIFTYIFTKWFAKIVKEGKLLYFSIYCIILGVVVLLFI